MKIIKSFFFCSVLFSSFLIVSKNSIIVLYGCSSAGKTSISSELLRILPGNWQYIASNRFRMHQGNQFLWKEINQQVAKGYDVIVDTHDLEFLIDDLEHKHVVVCLIYCSPQKLIEHVVSRNMEYNTKNHRLLTGVFQEYMHKFKAVKKHEPHVDVLSKYDLQHGYSFSQTRALKAIISKFFLDHQSVVYIAPKIKNYDCLINTGKTSVQHSAIKIKQALELKLNNNAN